MTSTRPCDVDLFSSANSMNGDPLDAAARNGNPLLSNGQAERLDGSAHQIGTSS